MGDEIDKLELAKLEDIIKQVDKPLPRKLQRLKTTLDKEINISPSSSSSTNKASTNRHKIYKLNNLLTEWLSKQPSTIRNHEPQPQSDGEASPDGPRNQEREEIYRWSNQFVDEKSVFGLKDKVSFFRRLILPQPSEKDDAVFRMLALVGTQGIGKTTLAKMVFNQPEIRRYYLPSVHFDHSMVWICLSKQPGEDPIPEKEIVKRMLRSLGVEDNIINYADTNHQLRGLLYTLRQQLLRKRYLIVLDDVYIGDARYLDFISSLERNITKCEERLAYGLPKECGGAIIVTSRSKEIAKKLVSEENLHKVLPLRDEECWEIFKHTYEKEGESVSNDMKILEYKIRDKCNGLPLAAKMMGEIAKHTEV